MPVTIAETFANLKSADRMAFMPFITAGDPDLGATTALIQELAGRGVDLIEVGFPYSDPIADGPVIQASYTRALEASLHVNDIFQAIAELDTDALPPLVAMVSYAVIFRVGPEQFAARASEAGFRGLIVPDLPGDEAAEMFAVAQNAGLDLIQLVAPTTPPSRVQAILSSCSGFVYCIAVAGTTGVREQVAEGLAEQLARLRESTDLPLAVGFGISRPEHLEPLRGLAEGAIVGSGIVRYLQDVADGKMSVDEAVKAIGDFAGEIAQAAHQS